LSLKAFTQPLEGARFVVHFHFITGLADRRPDSTLNSAPTRVHVSTGTDGESAPVAQAPAAQGQHPPNGQQRPAPPQLPQEAVNAFTKDFLPFITRVAILSSPQVFAREPMHVAAFPIPLDKAQWIGGVLMTLQARGVPVENYISHGPTLAYTERLLGFDIPLTRAEKDGALSKVKGGRFVPRHRDLEIALSIGRKMRCGEEIRAEQFDELAREGRVNLIMLYYY